LSVITFKLNKNDQSEETILKLLNNLDEYKMTIGLLKETKLGKVINKLAHSNNKSEKVKTQAAALLKQYMSLLDDVSEPKTKSNGSSSASNTTNKTNVNQNNGTSTTDNHEQQPDKEHVSAEIEQPHKEETTNNHKIENNGNVSKELEEEKGGYEDDVEDTMTESK